MNWLFLTILVFSLLLACVQKKVSKDLVLFLGGGVLLLLGVVRGKAVIQTVFEEPLLISIALFFLAVGIGKKKIKVFKEEMWTSLAAGFLFVTGLKETGLVQQVARELPQISPFILVGLFLVGTYFLAHFLPPLFVLLFVFPWISFFVGDSVAVAMTLIAVLSAFFNAEVRTSVRAGIRLPIVIMLLLTSSFLIPQFFLNK